MYINIGKYATLVFQPQALQSNVLAKIFEILITTQPSK